MRILEETIAGGVAQEEPDTGQGEEKRGAAQIVWNVVTEGHSRLRTSHGKAVAK